MYFVVFIEIHSPLQSSSEYPTAHSQEKFVCPVAIHVALLLHGLLSQTCATIKNHTQTLIILCYFLPSFTGDKRFLHSVKITDLNNLQILCAFQCILPSFHYTPLEKRGDYSLKDMFTILIAHYEKKPH